MKTITSKRSLILAISVMTLCLAGALACWGDSLGTVGGLMLTEPQTARSSALGGAGSTLTDDPSAVFYNPAGLASMKLVKGIFTHQGGVASDSYENLNVAFPVGTAGVAAATLVYHWMDTLNDAGGAAPAVDANDKLGILSFARSGEELLPGLSYGLNVKFLTSALGSYSANAYAADLGVLWAATPDTLLALSVRNLGTPLKFIDQSDPLPARYVLGGKYYFLQDTMEKLSLAVDVEQTTDAQTLLHFGAEYVYSGVVSVRLGYADTPDGTDGLTLGLGIQSTISTFGFRLDYAYKTVNWSSDVMEGTNLFTLGFMF